MGWIHLFVFQTIFRYHSNETKARGNLPGFILILTHRLIFLSICMRKVYCSVTSFKKAIYANKDKYGSTTKLGRSLDSFKVAKILHLRMVLILLQQACKIRYRVKLFSSVTAGHV